jgi:hypothetical protein
LRWSENFPQRLSPAFSRDELKPSMPTGSQARKLSIPADPKKQPAVGFADTHHIANSGPIVVFLTRGAFVSGS